MTTKQLYEKIYGNMPDSFREWRELSGRIKAQNIISVVNPSSIQTVLDIGSGTGAVLAHLAQQGFASSYYSIDIVEDAPNFVRQRGDIPGLVEARTFDGSTIPYQDQQFDLAILSHVIEHIDDPVPLLREAARVARQVVVEVPLEANLHIFLKVKVFGSRYREEIGHIQWFSMHSFRHLLEQTCGFDIQELKLVYLPDESYLFRKQGSSRLKTAIMLWVRKLLRSASSHLYARLLTDHCIAVVRARQ